MKLRFPKRRKTDQITVETDQILVIRRQRVTRTWCGECQSDADFIPIEEINQLIGGLSPAGTRPLGQGLHFGKALDGSVVVCANSVTNKKS